MRAAPVTPRQVMFTVCGQCPSLHAEGLIIRLSEGQGCWREISTFKQGNTVLDTVGEKDREETSYFFGLLNVARMGEQRGVYRVLVGKPEGKRPLGRPRRRWVDNIRTDPQEVG